MHTLPKGVRRDFAPSSTSRAVAALIFVCALTGTRSGQAQTFDAGSATAVASPRLVWLAEPGQENLLISDAVKPWPLPSFAAMVPGTVYVFSARDAHGPIKRMALASDPAPVYGVAATSLGVVVAGREKDLALWLFGDEGAPRLRFTQALEQRATAVAWNGGERVYAATWDGRLHAFSSLDGRRLWSVELGGKADAPALAVADTVYVATKARALIAIDAMKGVKRWSAPLPGSVIHPLALLSGAPSAIVSVTSDGQLAVIDAQKGLPLWTMKLSARASSAPTAFSEGVAVVTADGRIACYGPTGLLRWQMEGVAEGRAEVLRAYRNSRGALWALSRAPKVLDSANGALLLDYPEGAIADLKRRFGRAMIEGERVPSEAEKRRLIEEQAFDIIGELHGSAASIDRNFVFGTDEGWLYLFDRDSLRPIWRFHAGQPVQSFSAYKSERVVAATQEEVHAFDLKTGHALWRRNIGGRPGAVAIGAAQVLAMTADRLQVLDAATGAIIKSVRGSFRGAVPAWLAPSDDTQPAWLLDERAGPLRAISATGEFLGEAGTLGQTVAKIFAMAPYDWIVSFQEGRLIRLSWDAAPAPRLVVRAEIDLGNLPADVILTEGPEPALVVRDALGLARLDPQTLGEAWRIGAASDERMSQASLGSAVILEGAAGRRVIDGRNGNVILSAGADPLSLAADYRAGSLVSIRRDGSVHLKEPGAAASRMARDLGLPLARAAVVADGFLITTRAGEIGLVALGASASSSPSGKN